MSYNIELLTNQITVAEKLLKKVAFIPDGRQDMYGIVFYDKELVQIISNEEDEWERETVEYLILIYGDKSRQVEEFKRCLAQKNQYFNFREDLKKDLNSCIATLKAFKNAYEIKSHLAAQQPVEKSSKPPKIFISHKSEDRLFVKELVRMLEFIVGTSEKNIFCSSIPGYDIKPSREILKELKKQFEENEVYFIIVHSPRYYKSSICLNEMGAAWVLGTKFCSFLTSDC